MTSRRSVSSDTVILLLIALAVILLHALTGGRYGFHRDELATVDDGQHLAWGFVAYPPFTPFVARVAFTLFGPSLVGLRLFAALAIGVAIVLTGWMARELGGGREAQVVAAASVAIAPVALSAGGLFQYVSFDYLCWVAIAYFTIRLLASDDPHWWLAIGAAIGLGMLTKYTIGVLVAGLAVGVVLTPARRYLKNGWLWAGAGLAVLIFLPNAIWQTQHHFISVDFLRDIHARDVRVGRTKGFLPDQLLIGASAATIPIWVAGLWRYFSPKGRQFRVVGWTFVTAFVLFEALQGRGYYLAPAYPMLLAAGSVEWERWIGAASIPRARARRAALGFAITVGGVASIFAVAPIAPVGSWWWEKANKIQDDWREEIGWPELVAEVARVRDRLPQAERANVTVLTGNYGEGGAIDLFGGAYGLPKAISGINSYWLRGYGAKEPETLIVVGISRGYLEKHFEQVELAGHVRNSYNVVNEETREHPDIFVCRGLKGSWTEFWKDFQYFG
jgi:4-amino-4-deoxy-L-arabinose transferase-like glycosyltransferase